MDILIGRYRNLVILVGVLFLQVLGLATQVKRAGGNDAEHTRLIRIWVVGAITPFERGVMWIENGAGGLFHNYIYLRGVRAENRELKAQIEQMRLEQVRLSEDAAQARRLQTLLAFKEQFISRTVAAQVIGSSGSDLSRVLYIDKGENAGIKRDMAVMTADGIVGKVLVVYPSVSQILVINDQSSGVGAMLEKTRLQGVLRGSASGEIMLERVMSDEQVPVGETVLTSGGDQIFPKGLPVGTVAKVGNGKDLFLNITVKPAADLSKLEEVLVLVEKQEKQATADDSKSTRASDILAQRLPSVPEKPAASAVLAPGTTSGSTTGVAAKPAAANAGSKPVATPNTAGAQAPKNPAGTPSSGAGLKPEGSKSTPANTSANRPPNQSLSQSPRSSVNQSPSTAPSTAPATAPKVVKPSVPASTAPPDDGTSPH